MGIIEELYGLDRPKILPSIENSSDARKKGITSTSSIMRMKEEPYFTPMETVRNMMANPQEKMMLPPQEVARAMIMNSLPDPIKKLFSLGQFRLDFSYRNKDDWNAAAKMRF